MDALGCVFSPKDARHRAHDRSEITRHLRKQGKSPLTFYGGLPITERHLCLHLSSLSVMSLLSTSTSALLTFQRAMNTTAHNLANQKTAGYSRQSVSLATCKGADYPYGQVGGGVRIVDIRRDADALATSRMLDSGGELARLQQMSALANRVDALFSDKATNVAGMWSNFFDAANALASDAAANPQRQQLLDSANALSTRFQQLDREFAKMDDEINARLRSGCEEINRLSSEIARLNGEIGSNAAASPDMLDRRDQLVAELVNYTGGTAIVQDGSQLNVISAGGHALVVGSNAATITTSADPYQPGRLHLTMRTQGQDIPMDDKSFGGQIGGLFEFRRDILDQGRADLGRLAVGLAEQFNRVHQQGVDLRGNPGGDFFSHLPPRVAAHSGNQGSAQLSARYGDLQALSGQEVQLYFKDGAWSARDARSGAVMPLEGSGTADDPLRINGVELTVEGGAKDGDTFLLQPTSGVAGSLAVAITDPAKIAAAAPIKGAAGLNNAGHAKISAVSVTDVHHADLLQPVTVEFTSPNTYRINGGQEMTWKEGEPIAANGWQFSLDTAPSAGDTFTIQPTGPNSSDNSNARQLVDVETTRIFGGTLSLKDSVDGLTTSIGSAARDAEVASKAQSILHEQAQTARDAISGVNENEELADAMQLQQAYQAAAQLMSTADTLFQTLLNATRH